ncbi:MAG: glycine C-acetyltransferase [Acidobacteria bacterium]|nr:MAG: glycine C-acetyltransferase [Acidobacteriota bacterium]REJ98201.1 MAG: glycine C-acetyltransferase [Acidobacteriota bacterium]REK16945.1 MAG: glycine C-acetyltransferase [Acidobacteriota bacterium]REK42855.1 MAG: glycine C-acetyltransferase [Acidobacteriota bacterium]
MYSSAKQQLSEQLDEIREAGLYKSERVIQTPQDAHIDVAGGEVLNMCANNYLGLADDPSIVEAAKKALDDWGYGLASVRFICGTQTIHKVLEEKISEFLGTEDTILYAACFDANGGLFEPLFEKADAIISDELNHASIIDGIRLCKAARYRFKNSDMDDLEAKLKEASGARRKIIATDGVFSMDGYIAKLDQICDLADKYDAMVMIDDCHSTGFVGASGRGTHEYHGVVERVDVITGTLGKALGGASGGFTSGRKEIIDILRQRSRPYLFSNSVAPPIVAASIRAIEMLTESTALRDRLMNNTAFFREEISKIGLEVLPGEHPIVPVMLGDATLASKMADLLLTKGVYVIGFSYPVVPMGKARIRTQVSAAHSMADLEFAVAKFREAKEELGI